MTGHSPTETGVQAANASSSASVKAQTQSPLTAVPQTQPTVAATTAAAEQKTASRSLADRWADFSARLKRATVFKGDGFYNTEEVIATDSTATATKQDEKKPASDKTAVKAEVTKAEEAKKTTRIAFANSRSAYYVASLFAFFSSVFFTEKKQPERFSLWVQTVLAVLISPFVELFINIPDAIGAFFVKYEENPASFVELSTGLYNEEEADNDEKTEATVKPAEVKPTEVKPTEVKPTEVKPAEVKPAEVKPTEVKPTEVKPTEVKTAEVKTAEVKTAEVKTAEVKTAEAKTAEVKTAEVKAIDKKSAKPTLLGKFRQSLSNLNPFKSKPENKDSVNGAQSSQQDNQVLDLVLQKQSAPIANANELSKQNSKKPRSSKKLSAETSVKPAASDAGTKQRSVVTASV